MKIIIQTLIIGAFGAAAMTAPPAIASDADKTESKAKKPKKITDRRHPDYVRCRSEPVIGSLTKKRRLCMTNSDWADYVRKGSRDSQEFVDGLQSGSNQSN